MDKFNEKNTFVEIYRYISFWPYFLLSSLIFITAAFIYLRYENYIFESNAKIQIIDDAQDSEMALPTAMTIFNRSMVNLENEIGVLSSYRLHRKVINILNSNVKLYSVGTIKTSESHISDWFDNYELTYNIDLDTITEQNSFKILFNENKMIISHFDKYDDFVRDYEFNNLSTSESNHDLPFNLTISENSGTSYDTKLIKFFPANKIAESYMKSVIINEIGRESDQLFLSLRHENYKIADDYLNTLISEFDKDGIYDRQLEYKRTMDFVDLRSGYLSKELEKIEIQKRDFKKKNNIANIQEDANINVQQQFSYDAELFSAISQRDLSILLKEALEEAVKDNKFDLMPVNIGIENPSINDVISKYNLVVQDRNRYLISAGPNNPYLKSFEDQLINYSKNILISVNNYMESLDLTISNLEIKEKEFRGFYGNIPENEKILRSIERELEIKESLFLLLLQKREEAAINFAVVKPSIKIIDYARSEIDPVFPIPLVIIGISFLASIFFPLLFLFLWFKFDTKIHNREDLVNNLDDIPIVGEIPFITDEETVKKILSPTNSRHPLIESIRMLIANLNFVLFDNKSKNNFILVTSSIKGEGKTVVSVNLASMLSSKYKKILLVGADLRNPQIHKFINVDKNVPGLSDYIYKDEKSVEKFVIKNGNFDILLSGTIPPNPTELLTSPRFSSFVDEIKDKYDYIIIDSAPCILVSDTFEISKFVDTTLYVTRSNYSDINLCEFINECKNLKKLSNINLILNSVGNSRKYGYQYGYQYGYKYGYKYGYNYGYGYGYSEDKSD